MVGAPTGGLPDEAGNGDPEWLVLLPRPRAAARCHQGPATAGHAAARGGGEDAAGRTPVLPEGMHAADPNAEALGCEGARFGPSSASHAATIPRWCSWESLPLSRSVSPPQKQPRNQDSDSCACVRGWLSARWELRPRAGSLHPCRSPGPRGPWRHSVAQPSARVTL